MGGSPAGPELSPGRPNLNPVREFFSGLSRAELALMIVVATALLVWAAVGPRGILAGVLPALAVGLLCGVTIGVGRARSGR